MKLSFTKMQGCANDYIYLDCRESGVPENIAALSQDLSRRHFSIGADGIICICAPVTAGADGRMRIFNADGSEAQMCGNGVRCVAEWLYTHGVAKETLVVDTGSGPKTITRKGRQLWQVEMGGYSAMAAALPAVNMGEGPLGDCPLTVEGRTWRVACTQRGQPPLRHRRGRCGQPEARGHRPGLREAPELPGAGQHRVRAGGDSTT